MSKYISNMEPYQKPIGVFDSGIGGLTVLEKLLGILPDEDVIYVGDQKNCPYGIKTPDEIAKCALNVSKFLLLHDVKAIVIACNTASLFIHEIKKITDIPVISVIEPTCDFAMKVSNNKKIAVLGTNATISNGKYQKIINANGHEAFGVPCSPFVDFIESRELDDPYGDQLVESILKDLPKTEVDTIIYGCTHFSLLESQIKKVMGDINYIACGDPTSLELKKILEEKGLLNRPHEKRYVKIGTTGSIENALSTMKWFKEPHESIVQVELDKPLF